MTGTSYFCINLQQSPHHNIHHLAALITFAHFQNKHYIIHTTDENMITANNDYCSLFSLLCEENHPSSKAWLHNSKEKW